MDAQTRPSHSTHPSLAEKKESMTDEEFYLHWTYVHGPLVSGWLARHGILKYSQYYQSPELRDKSSELWCHLGLDSITRDGHVKLHGPSLDRIVNALAGPFYKDKVIPDENKFLSAKSCMRTVGYEHCFILNNEVVKSPPLLEYSK